MTQHDLNIANQGFPSTRADINSALQALGSNSSGGTAPSTTYAYQYWYDTSTDILKLRDSSNSVWISMGSFNQSTNEYTPITTAFATVASPTLTGVPAAPTAAVATDTTQIATTAFVKDVVAGTGSASAETADLPNGTSLRSGNGVTSGTTTVTFPAAFPNDCLQVVACHNGGAAAMAVVSGLTATSFDVSMFNNGGTQINAQYRYIAIGY